MTASFSSLAASSASAAGRTSPNTVPPTIEESSPNPTTSIETAPSAISTGIALVAISGESCPGSITTSPARARGSPVGGVIVLLLPRQRGPPVLLLVLVLGERAGHHHDAGPHRDAAGVLHLLLLAPGLGV